MKKKLPAILYNLVCAVLLTMPAAHAYFDPGVTSMLVSSLAAAALAIGLCWKFIVAGIRKLFKKDKGAADESDDSDDEISGGDGENQ